MNLLYLNIEVKSYFNKCIWLKLTYVFIRFSFTIIAFEDK